MAPSNPEPLPCKGSDLPVDLSARDGLVSIDLSHQSESLRERFSKEGGFRSEGDIRLKASRDAFGLSVAFIQAFCLHSHLCLLRKIRR
jgi:hypothetical protein